MKCPHCQNEIADGLAVCPNCRLSLVGYVAPAPAVSPPAQEPGPPEEPFYDRQEDAMPETVAAPLPALKSPPPGLPGDKLFLSFSEKPDAIVRIMDEAVRKESAYIESNRRQLRIFTLLVPVGALFIILDLVVGGGLVSLALVGYACWAAALIGWWVFRRSRAFGNPEPPAGAMPALSTSSRGGGCSGKIVTLFFVIIAAGFFMFPWTVVSIFVSEAQLTFKSFWVALLIVIFFVLIILYIVLWVRRSRGSDFGPKFAVARGIFETLKDDVSPKRTFIGWLDLTGMQQPGKQFREKTSESGMPVSYYRDEWLRMKATLYDGSLLRVSAVERSKVRMGRWKRGRSGKTKWKPGGIMQAREVLRLVVAPNPSTHQLAGEVPAVLPGSTVQIGNYLIESLQAEGERLVCEAVSNQAVGAWDLLQVMKYAHSFIKPRVDASTAATD